MKRHLFILCILLGLVGTKLMAENIIYYSCKKEYFGKYNVTVVWGFSGYGHVEIPATVKNPDNHNDSRDYTVAFIASEAFKGEYDITSVTIPNSIIEIGLRAFQGCDGLTTITIPNSVTTIDKGAFNDCI